MVLGKLGLRSHFGERLQATVEVDREGYQMESINSVYNKSKQLALHNSCLVPLSYVGELVKVTAKVNPESKWRCSTVCSDIINQEKAHHTPNY